MVPLQTWMLAVWIYVLILELTPSYADSQYVARRPVCKLTMCREFATETTFDNCAAMYENGVKWTKKLKKCEVSVKNRQSIADWQVIHDVIWLDQRGKCARFAISFFYTPIGSLVYIAQLTLHSLLGTFVHNLRSFQGDQEGCHVVRICEMRTKLRKLPFWKKRLPCFSTSWLAPCCSETYD